MAAICASITETIHLIGSDRSIFFHAGFHANPHRVARARRNELFFPVIFITHRASGCNCQMSGHVLDQDFLFAAKTTADARLNHADTFNRQPQHRGKHTPHVERHLCAGANDQAIILVPVTDRHVWLDVRLLHFRHLVYRFINFVGLSKPLLYVPDIDADFSRQIFSGVRVGKINKLEFIMNANRSILHRIGGVQDDR